MKFRAALSGGLLAVGAAAWFPMTSLGTTLALHTYGRTDPAILPLAAYYYWRDFGAVPAVSHALTLSAAGSATLAVLPAFLAMCWPAGRRLRAAHFGETPPAPRRAYSDAHGNADWLTMAAARKLFPGPAPGYGGVVVGEAYRVDQDRPAGQAFDPGDRATWGKGGKAPLLIDPCTADATHGLVFAGSGGFKTTAVAIPTLAHWTGSAVVLDPSCQLGPMTGPMRKAMGHKVAMVGPGLDGFNVLAWIDPTDPLAEAHVISVVDRIAGEMSAKDAGENAMFKIRGKELIACLLADLLWDDKLPRTDKTLRTLRERITTPEKKMKGLLADIHEGSRSKLARDLAGTLVDVFIETFSGIYSNANSDTQWLSVTPYADMLSGGSFDAVELAGGKLTVFVQVPMDALRSTPQLARVLVGSLLNAAYQAQGKLNGRVLFLLDEVNFLGRLKVLEDARDAGRKYGITLICMWQALGQLVDTWGKDGKSSWFNSCSWRMFASIDDDDTAQEISRTAGRYTILTRTQGNTDSRGSSFGSNNRGRSENLSEQPRELIRPDEVRTRMRSDEAIIFRRGALPLRVGRAIYFRRPEMVAQVEADRFRTAAE
jgi:type IV secretion system protein VirD4